MNSYERDQKAYECYKIFQMLKLHFAGKYNMFLYNMKAPEGTGCFIYSKYDKRKDKKAYYRLAELSESIDDIRKFLIPIFASSKTNIKSVFDIVDHLQECNNIYEDWQNRVDNLKDNFLADIKKLKNIKSYLESPEKLFLQYYSNVITLESFVLLDSLLQKKYKNNTVSNLYKNLLIKCRAYRGFISYTNDEVLNWICPERPRLHSK